MRTRLAGAASVGTLLFLATGCSTGPSGTGRLTLQLAGTPPLTAAPSFAAGDELTITSVQVVARKIKLERAEGTCPADEGDPNAPDQSTSDCAVVWLDSQLLEPPITDQAAVLFTVDLPEGTYASLMLQIHMPTAAADADFLAANPGFENVSIKVTGTFNGADFTFTTPLTSVIQIPLDAPVDVSSETPVAVTLQLDLNSWFSDGAGGVLDPTNPSTQIRSTIEQNIRQSFHAFEDADQNGQPD